MDNSAKAAIDIQSKFELYFVTLIFTLLGLAIQTSEESASFFVALFEVLSWIVLLCAGLAGMDRIVRIPIILNVFSMISREESTLQELKKHRLIDPYQSIQFDDGMLQIDDIIRNYSDNVEKLESQKKLLNKRITGFFKFQWYSFVVALLLLIFSRGNEKFIVLWDKINSAFL